MGSQRLQVRPDAAPKPAGDVPRAAKCPLLLRGKHTANSESFKIERAEKADLLPRANKVTVAWRPVKINQPCHNSEIKFTVSLLRRLKCALHPLQGCRLLVSARETLKAGYTNETWL